MNYRKIYESSKDEYTKDYCTNKENYWYAKSPVKDDFDAEGLDKVIHQGLDKYNELKEHLGSPDNPATPEDVAPYKDQEFIFESDNWRVRVVYDGDLNLHVNFMTSAYNIGALYSYWQTVKCRWNGSGYDYFVCTNSHRENSLNYYESYSDADWRTPLSMIREYF